MIIAHGRIVTNAEGYDCSGLRPGLRVQLHPGLDLWMQGCRYGTVRRLSSANAVVELDRLPPGRGRRSRLVCLPHHRLQGLHDD